MNISIVIPVFNERDSLPDLVDELVHNLSEYKTWEVIFIDDCSIDVATECLSKLCIESKNFKTYPRETNKAIGRTSPKSNL